MWICVALWAICVVTMLSWVVESQGCQVAATWSLTGVHIVSHLVQEGEKGNRGIYSVNIWVTSSRYMCWWYTMVASAFVSLWSIVAFSVFN